ncbi:hypothetical protein COEREDRAFT_8873 [Coemansia reversa NRRL 1564]|uniref:Uncharacterized protein n=1 Tax=Coemansia reversa (strain ATCC 12441 / NRRL 1564) TaxID=763665 RepID=A0A2G5BA64_COERN|nr:hypothetical protein COEREDRAFT_8873 [Coemansia reversa NRRL 1564]|eukprot:PIA15909.1 hypothetical protein COEREDRAFT_8873 [Coemansia reversa NRRL 1564]
MAAIAAVSTELKICTRTEESEAANMLILRSDSNKVVRRLVARNPGTTVTVSHPFSKLPVRYNIVKSQSTHIKAEICKWLKAYCIANYTLSIKLTHTGVVKGPSDSKEIFSFFGVLSLSDAVSHFIEPALSEYLLSIKYPDERKDKLSNLATYNQIKGTSFEGVFSRSTDTKSQRLPGLFIAINGTVCSSDTLPGFKDQLRKMYWKDSYNGTQSSNFLGVLNLTVPISNIDSSSKTPSLLCQFATETIISEVIESIKLAECDISDKLKPQPVQHTLDSGSHNGTASIKTNMLQWSRGNCNIGSPTVIHRPCLKRSANELGCDALDKPLPNKTRRHTASNVAPIAVKAHGKNLNALDIPKTTWRIHSQELDELFTIGTTREVLCWFSNDGSVCRPGLRSLANIALCLIRSANALIMLDVQGLPLASLLSSTGEIQLHPSMKSRACAAQIANS